MYSLLISKIYEFVHLRDRMCFLNVPWHLSSLKYQIYFWFNIHLKIEDIIWWIILTEIMKSQGRLIIDK